MRVRRYFVAMHEGTGHTYISYGLWNFKIYCNFIIPIFISIAVSSPHQKVEVYYKFGLNY